MSTIWTLSQIQNKDTLHRGKDCMKKFSNSLRKHAKNIEELKSHQHAKVCYNFGKRTIKFLKI